MGREHREQLGDLLADLRAGGSFATRRTAPWRDLSIEVRGVGPLRLPVTAAQAKELRLVARPAKYGQGELTVLDRRVRDTWEVPRSRVRIDKRRWNKTLGPMLDSIRDDLGLGPEARLRAELHSMLVYEPGQFFAAHQDSEKSDAMIGSLVVMLPSKSTGGDLVIEHRGESVRYRGSASSLTFVAFYSDTRHEVLPVQRGYRVVLTYNLMLSGDTSSPRAESPELAAAVASLLEEHFAELPEPRWRGDREALDPPDRLVFLLDHQYTERGLRWAQLKGDDAVRADVLARAVEQIDCDITLAHAQVHEIWECYDDEPYWGRGRRYWDEEPSSGAGADDPGAELGSLIDSSVTITPMAGAHVAFEPAVSYAELAAATPSVELTPCETEYTGYMGNWGNTMDRWYQRAAIVIWPRGRAFALEARADPRAAVHRILEVAADSPDRAPEMVTTLLRFWPDALRRGDPSLLLPPALRLAWELSDEALATSLLEPFSIETLAPADAAVLLALTEQFGTEWLDRQVTTWFGNHPNRRAAEGPDRATWTAGLHDLCAAIDAGVHTEAQLRTDCVWVLVGHGWVWLEMALGQAAAVQTPSQREAMLAGLSGPLLAVLRSALVAGDSERREVILDSVGSRRAELAPTFAGVVEAAEGLSASELTATGVAAIAHHLAETAEEELARPERAPGDWSITGFPDPDHCSDCTQFSAFLADADRRQWTWPLAKPRRRHIHQRIDATELPLTHRTIHEGSPHKLVLTKTDDLFRRDAAARGVARSRQESAQALLDSLS